MITVGIVGAGRIARVHARHLRTVGVETILVQDAREGATEGFPGESVPELGALIERADLVAVCTPSATHRAIAEQALDAGKAVFVEKPVALTVPDGEALVAKGGFVAVGQVVRHFPAYRHAHDAIARGHIGDPAVMRLTRVGGFPGADGRAWYGDHAVSGGVFVDLAIHDLDWLLWTLGPATRVLARSIAAERGTGPDHGLATITMAGGVLAHVEASWTDPGPFRTAYDLAGSAGLLEYDSRAGAGVRFAGGAESPLAPEDDPYACQWRAVLTAFEEGAPPPVDAAGGVAALRLAAACRESAITGEAVIP